MNEKQQLSGTAAAARDWAQSLIRPICKYPDNMHVKVFATPHRLTLSPRCEASDAGLVIGKYGDVFRCLRRMVELWGERNHLEEIVELSSVKTPNGEQESSRVAEDGTFLPNKFTERARWDMSKWRDAVDFAADTLLGHHGATVEGDGPVMLTYWVDGKSMLVGDMLEAAELLDVYGQSVAMTVGGDVRVDVGDSCRRKEPAAA